MSPPTEGSGMGSQNYDIICVGFSIEGLALAVSLADRKTERTLLFIDRNDAFKAGFGFHNVEDHAGSLFLKDLITLQNPKSEFTFINYLHETQLLVGFTNVSQMKPSRVLLESYLKWAAKKIEALGWVSFQSEAITINPIRSRSTKSFDSWELRVRDNSNGRIATLQTQRLVMTARAPRSIPSILQGANFSDHVLLMHQFEQFQKTVAQAQRPLNIAVLGASQQAVECFQEIVSGNEKNRACMVFPGSALRVDDSTPFVQALIDGHGKLSPYNKLPPEVRHRLLASTVATDFPTVNLETLESLYANLYLQHVRSNDISHHRFALHSFSQIVRASKTEQGILLHNIDVRTGEIQTPLGPFDIVLTEVYRDARQGPKIMAPIRPLLEKQTLTVNAEYSVNFHKNTFSVGSGLWMLGSLGSQYVRRDDLSILAASAHRAMSSISKEIKVSAATEVETQPRL